MEQAFDGKVSTSRLLAIRDFRTLWLGSLLYISAYFVDVVARPWLAYQVSGSGLMIGLVALSNGVAQVIAGLVGGVAADRFDKRRVLIFTHIALTAIALVSALIVSFGIVRVWQLVVLGLLQGCFAPISFPARQAYIPELVGQRYLANAIALDASGKNMVRVLATALAGLLLAWNPTIAFFTIAALHVSSTLTVLRLPKSHANRVVGGSALAVALSGLWYVWEQRLIRTLIGMALVPMLAMSYQQLLPVFQTRVLHVSPSHLGLMYTSIGVGSLAGSLLTTKLSAYRRQELAQIVAGVVCGLSLFLFALSATYETSLVLLFVVGLTIQCYFTLNSIQIMANTTREFQGRVMSIYALTWGIAPMATMLMGAFVDIAGAPVTVAGVGAVLVLFFAVFAGSFLRIGGRLPSSIEGDGLSPLSESGSASSLGQKVSRSTVKRGQSRPNGW